MNPLQAALQEYLQVRRGLGFQLDRTGRLLPDFLCFLEREHAQAITTELAVRWAMAPSTALPRWWAVRLSMVRGFARYMAARDSRTEIPPQTLLPLSPARRLVPYVYTQQDIDTLIRTAHTLRGLKGTTYATLLGLLAVTGMRVGEAIDLQHRDIDWRAQVLVVRAGKFGKSRELALHPTALKALRAYARERDRLLPHPRSPCFLLSLAGTRLHYKNVHRCFLRLLHQAGLTQRRAQRPRLHDLRHTFAIKTLVEWYRTGLDVQARLPALSTYLGHVNPSQTYWYLTASPELLRFAHPRFERFMGDLP